MPTYLVTGCAGFIASRVARMLLDAGLEVIGIDNLNDAYDVRLKRWRLEQLYTQPRFRFHLLDIADQSALRRLASSLPKPEAVLNLAARAGVRQSVAAPQACFDSNVTGALNLLEMCREHGVRKFLLASTSSLYGDNNDTPYREDGDTSRPLSPYAATKAGAEALCHSYHHLFGIDVIVPRFFTVYGPAGRPDMSAFRFVQWVIEGRPVTVYGDGLQERDFTYIDDIARGVVAALSLKGFEVINLGSDQPIRVLDLIRIVEQAAGRKAEIQFHPGHRADVAATWANIDKARELLHWEPQTCIESGVRHLVDWYSENRDWAREIVTAVPSRPASEPAEVHAAGAKI